MPTTQTELLNDFVGINAARPALYIYSALSQHDWQSYWRLAAQRGVTSILLIPSFITPGDIAKKIVFTFVIVFMPS
jgi:hypothetical protein